MPKVITVSDELHAYIESVINKNYGKISTPRGLYEIVYHFDQTRKIIRPKEGSLLTKKMFPKPENKTYKRGFGGN